MVSAGAIVTQNSIVPQNTLAVGIPAKIKRDVNYNEIEDMKLTIEEYREVAKEYKLEVF